MGYFLLLVVLLGLDQWTKHLIKVSFDLGQTMPVIENIFHLTYIHNYGAAFSILLGKQLLLSVIGTVAILAILVYIWVERKRSHPFILTALTFIAGGGLGNLCDRLSQGYVVDFLDFRVFPIFNVADIFVTVGSVFIFIYLFFIEPKSGRKSWN
ncbi:MAG: signal peptidase II [Anaerovoracaceae bacterium]|jgi:signal peptidase II